MRWINLIVVVAFVLAAVHVYKIKFDATVQAERLAKLRVEIRRERDAIAALRAEWARLDNPARIQGLVERHSSMRPMETSQIDTLDRLPERAPDLVPPEASDPIGAMISGDFDYPTGGIAPAKAR